MGILDRFKEKQGIRRHKKITKSFAKAKENMLKNNNNELWFAFNDWIEVEKKLTPPTNNEEKNIMCIVLLWQAAIELFSIEKAKLALGLESVQQVTNFKSTVPPEPSWPLVAKSVIELISRATQFIPQESTELAQDISDRAKRIQKLELEEAKNTPEYKEIMLHKSVMPGLIGSALSGFGGSIVDDVLIFADKTLKTSDIVTWVKTLKGHEFLINSL